MSIPRSLLGSVISFFLPSASMAAVITLGFESPPFQGNQDPYGSGVLYHEQGFVFSTPTQNAGSIIRFAPGQEPVIPDNGTVHFGGTLFSRPTLTAAGNAPFALYSIDLAHYSQHAPVSSVALVGTYFWGGTVTESFPIGAGFQTFELPETWTRLVKVELVASFMAWDNVTVAIVPEPAIAGLLLSGLAVAFRRRRPARDLSLAEPANPA